MTMSNNKSYIICGETGIGKSSYAIQKWKNYLLIDCDNPISKIKTYALIETTVSKITHKHYSDDYKYELLQDFFAIVNDKEGIIIDNAEKINEEVLKLFINIVKESNKNLIFIFDISYKDLSKSHIFLKLLDWNIIDYNSVNGNFKVSQDIIKKYIFSSYPFISEDEADIILEITGYNFNNIKKLMWINKTMDPYCKKLLSDAKIEYFQEWIECEFGKLSDELIDVLKKSSIIGEIFYKCILEDECGFNILGATDYLEDLEKKEIFISNHKDWQNDTYKFITHDIYNTVLRSIPSHKKNEWMNILKMYYEKMYIENHYNNPGINILNKIKEISVRLNDHALVFRLNHVLLYEYLKIEDYHKSIKILDELIEYTHNSINFKHYLMSIKLQLQLDRGDFKKSLDIINQYINDSSYKGSQNYLKYYYTKCLYNCGDTDNAYKEIVLLIENLKHTSAAGTENQEIYPMAYSLMASIQNHLGLGDKGEHYYTLALNYAYNKIDNKDIYYDILRKCEMYHDITSSYDELKECLNYFDHEDKQMQAARVCFNLATEMMFNGDGTETLLYAYFNRAKEVFKVIPDMNLAYAKNNLAIFYILNFNNIQAAKEELETSLFIGLDNFSYMTIYLNLSMCYFLLEGTESTNFKNTYKKFLEYESIIESRDNQTRYEIMYRKIAALIFNCDNTSKKIIRECDILLDSKHTPSFFIPIITDIRNRHSSQKLKNTYVENHKFYQTINQKKIFLAEFRFWD